jgi:hypothetical protein
LDLFAEIRGFLGGPATISTLPAWLESHPCTAGRQALLTYATTFTRADAPGLEGAEIVYKNPGLATVTTDGNDERVGLHVDNWYQASLERREHAPNRISINLGIEPRFFLYINLRLATLAEVMNNRFPDFYGAQEIQHGLRASFMSSCGSYPVVRVRLAPGEGYIAPTESMIHDASTEGGTALDLQFLVRGRFWPNVSA